ncbi:hypothetical protein [Polaribacter sp.]|uniref:hypothetical protein n=1 Tax=Polaribacter sp. TaxID=1920175 RepID=UPI004047B2FB
MNYKITEKQLSFLDDFLNRKYPQISNETRIELIDHLISDFEATTDNGNLSQYLSNELEFIRKFVFSGASKVKKSYSKETWNQFFSFFTNTKLLPITISVVMLFYFLNENFSDKISYLTLIISQTIIFGYSVFAGMINKKELRNIDEVKFLGAEIWLSFTLAQLLGETHIRELIISNTIIFTIYASFIIIHGLAAYKVLKKHKKIILEKYKHLLN